MAGDFNAWHEEWGSARTKRKGEELLYTVEQLGLSVLNRGVEPTFIGNSVARPNMLRYILPGLFDLKML
uniref:Endo/exonuclease/phosphatase domain-containing protein n=1 Tax=Anopheles dirus TaxID=7168 RepID=A0A182NT36_9DIPT